jgi:hypothetical protein
LRLASGEGSLGRRTGANAKGTVCGRGVAVDPFCVADPLFEHTYLNFFE